MEDMNDYILEGRGEGASAGKCQNLDSWRRGRAMLSGENDVCWKEEKEFTMRRGL